MTDSNKKIFKHILENNGESWFRLQKLFTQGSVNNFFKTFDDKPIIYRGEEYLVWEDHFVNSKNRKQCIIYVTLKKELLR